MELSWLCVRRRGEACELALLPSQCDSKIAFLDFFALKHHQYHSESWCLTEKLLHRLNCFHNRCIRSMCRVTKRQTWLHKIDSDTLRRRLKLEKMEYYISLRKLRWAGHLARMPMTRLPRQFLTSWVNHPRPHGRPQYTYGHSLSKSLKRAGIPSVFKEWSQLAQDRANWRKLFYAKAEFPPSRQS